MWVRLPAHRREDAEVFLTAVPRGTFLRGPSRTVRRADALAWMASASAQRATLANARGIAAAMLVVPIATYWTGNTSRMKM